jgi:hypothetical protein
MLRNLSISMFLVAMVACGGGGKDDGPDAKPAQVTTAAVSHDDAVALCMAGCQHNLDCDPDQDPIAKCAADCADEVAGWLRTDVLDYISTCAQTVDCAMKAEEVCLADIEPLAEHLAYEAKCRATAAACLEAGEVDAICSANPVSGLDDSGFIRWIAPEIIVEATACFDQACDAAMTCVQTTFESHGAKF